MRWWAFWRRVQYTIVFLIVFGGIGFYVYYANWYVAPTCFDALQNGDERGVDCGGACERICSIDINAPQPLWSQSFKVVDGQYNAVSYVENRNREIGTPALAYTIKLFDSEGLITERKGVTVLPPDGVYPIFEGRIMTGTRTPTLTTIEFGTNSVWLPAMVGREQFTLEQRDLKNADSKPRLIAKLRNTQLSEAKDVEVVATIFDSLGKPLTASRTIVEHFGGHTTEDVVFTWPEPIAKTLRSCDVPTDVVLAIDLSGSMNDDGGDPAEPIHSVLSAARSFVSKLGSNDHVGLVTYATGASLVEELTHERERVMDVIAKLSIDPKEERGSTNTGEALKRMTEEFMSVRHNDDARKVAVLLTDGLATAPEKDPEIYAMQEADTLKSHDVQLFTIGLGAKANEAFLTSIATDVLHYYKAPTIRELNSIYSAITESICEDGAAVIEIIAKPKTSFVETL